MAKGKTLFLDNDFIPNWGEEFSAINEPDFDTQVWTTELVDDLVDKIENYGLDIARVKNPFFDKNPVLRRGRIAFQLSDEELEEFKKCRKDIVYFANKFVQLMTDDGIQHITLYPYQEKMLLNYKEGKNNIVVGSRQIGKCFLANTKIRRIKFGKIVEEPIYILWWESLKGERTFLDYCKLGLYWLYGKLDK